ncbi:YciI family protein [Rhodococcus sp. NPDC078407]|uniref:YciI family protein n=1 Tax=Rhodococcus sp. NPDC078407 TaxID=3364509 RepID=UPI0037CBB822
MALIAVTYTYSPATTEGRNTHRATHRAWLAELSEQKTLVSSGPFADDSGALLLVEGADAASVESLFAQDPFAIENLIESASFREWIPVMGTFSS